VAIQTCLNKGIERLYFTSTFVERSFYLLFTDNPLPAFRLPSPSPAANRHIGGLSDYIAAKKKEDQWSPYLYRLQRYKILLRTD